MPRRPDLVDGYNPKTGTWAKDSKGGRFLKALEVGNFLTHAAGYAGISDRALMKWMARGRHHLDQQPDADPFDYTKLPKKERMFVHFVQEVTRARMSSVVELVTLMRTAADGGEWRAADRLLVMTDPEHFQPRQRHEVTGANGGPVRTATVTGVESALGPLLGDRRAKASTN